MRALAAFIMLSAGTPAALAQDYAASGHIGYLQEWEIKGSLQKTVTHSAEDFSGPVTLRHVGLCSANGVEEKSGTVHMSVSASRLEGTLAMTDDNCRIVASAASAHSGLLSCRGGGEVPINLVIDRAGVVDQRDQVAGK